ncbi:hypothetical protein ABPG72_013778 [Tetrahymena utriculariae]
MDEEKFNPFEIEKILDDRWKKEYYFQQMQVYSIAKLQVDMMNRINQRKPTLEYDDEYRDVLFSNTLKEEQPFPNYFYWARQHLSESKGIDGYSKYSEIVKKCQRRKMEFWKKYSNYPPTTDEKEQTKKIIRKVKWEQKGPTLATFFGLSVATMFLLNIAKGSHQSKVILVFLGFFSGNLYADFRNSESIFNNIPPLPDTEAEFEREKIINYCFPVDIQLMSKAFLE